MVYHGSSPKKRTSENELLSSPLERQGVRHYFTYHHAHNISTG
jgi:hypothetical protein